MTIMSLNLFHDLDLCMVAQFYSAKRFFVVTHGRDNDRDYVLTEEYALPENIDFDVVEETIKDRVIEVRIHENVDAAVRYASGEITRTLPQSY